MGSPKRNFLEKSHTQGDLSGFSLKCFHQLHTRSLTAHPWNVGKHFRDPPVAGQGDLSGSFETTYKNQNARVRLPTQHGNLLPLYFSYLYIVLIKMCI